ncbi:NDR1/HIN1-like protein 1 [Typha latifolia]|uniref:NDR1/HIN1-like protein 1 n=1 Tax=Typha latifolia TaxID=4733 RepID=UPI003C2E5591
MGDAKKSTNRHHHPIRLFSVLLLLLLFLLGLISLILYLIYRPSKPLISIASISIYSFSSSPSTPPPNLLSTSMQLTILFHNPNRRASVLYDRLSAYVTYHDEPITPPVGIPPLYQERASSVSVSPVLGSGFVPVSPGVVLALETDRAYGVASMRVVVLGRVKYKSGPFRSRWYGLYVTCDALVGVKKGLAGPAPLLGEPQCKVNV